MFNKDAIIKILNIRGYSRYRLCKEAKLAQSTLSDILSGESENPNIKTLQRIADALDVSVNEFFDEDTNNNSTFKQQNKTQDEDIHRIERARNKMPLKEKEKMMKILEASFEDYFDDED